MSPPPVRDRESDDVEAGRSPKRTKLDETSISRESTVELALQEAILPPSHALLGISPPELKDGVIVQIVEGDVGISEYVGRDVPKINGIIKQRFTDFLVYEVDLDSQVVHIKSLEKPESSPKKSKSEPSTTEIASAEPAVDEPSIQMVEEKDTIYTPKIDEDVDTPTHNDVSAVRSSNVDETQTEVRDAEEPWPERFNASLQPFLSEAAISQVKQMYLEGREPPRASDSGWGGRQTKLTEESDKMEDKSTSSIPEISREEAGKARRGKDRGGRGGRGGKRGGGSGGEREDHRKVLSDPISSKPTRTAFHQIIRELFGGKLDSETDSTAPANDEGSRIAIKWSRRGGRGQRGAKVDGGERAPRGTYPPYIHFTLQKTNRDTQDALAYLSRMLHVNLRDLSVAGTKDKRGVTVQRVSLKRGKKTVEDVWRLANGRKTLKDIMSQRGDRGVRLADFNYRKASLELGMLKGNAFVITLRNVQVDSMETVDRALNTIKHKGFINYYGMQRFGTASIPTHSIGLAILQSDWHKAVSMILRKRIGEHPDIAAARDAWLVDGDVDKALELMPRRVVAERCILESFKKQKGDIRNAMGALSTIPRNLRLMYVHAYQSYVWNAIVSERIRAFGPDKPVPGDLVFETGTGDGGEPGQDGQDMDVDPVNVTDDKEEDEEPDLSSARAKKRARKPWSPPRVKVLASDDLDKYTIFDVIMPLPGTDVDYPGGELGERYRAFLRADGLDPDNFKRKQREYTLAGSYRKIIHVPKELSWSVLRYTDPDVALAQADEDKLLGFDPPVVVQDGKFLALQLNLILGTAAYATMALREVTKTETSSHFQTGLTQASEDQKFRGEGLGGEE